MEFTKIIRGWDQRSGCPRRSGQSLVEGRIAVVRIHRLDILGGAESGDDAIFATGSQVDAQTRIGDHREFAEAGRLLDEQIALPAPAQRIPEAEPGADLPRPRARRVYDDVRRDRPVFGLHGHRLISMQADAGGRDAGAGLESPRAGGRYQVLRRARGIGVSRARLEDPVRDTVQRERRRQFGHFLGGEAFDMEPVPPLRLEDVLAGGTETLADEEQEADGPEPAVAAEQVPVVLEHVKGSLREFERDRIRVVRADDRGGVSRAHARQAPLLEQHDATEPSPGEEVRGARAHDPAPDDDRIGGFRPRNRRPAHPRNRSVSAKSTAHSPGLMATP